MDEQILIRISPVLEAAKCMNLDRPCVIAIDGRSASGKSTVADALAAALNADIVHMDDFFLPKELRTPERLASTGGNVHYERFIRQVLPCIAKNEEFEYDIFSCQTMDFSGKRKICSRKCRIVEGSYSCHPEFGSYADITVFSDIDSDEQIKRIIKRNGDKAAKLFAEKWIPMEEQYFKEFAINRKCSIVI